MKEPGSIMVVVLTATNCASTERFHRVNHDILELTVTIDDPKIYTKPWLALDKFPMRLQPPDFDIREMICSPSELAGYLKQVGNPEGGPTGESYPFRGR
jgi:hypothetical protein